MPPAMPRLFLTLFTAPHHRRLWRMLLLLLVGTITWLALSPAPPRLASTGWDKSNHALAFASLAFAGVWALWPRPRLWGMVALALLAYGGAIEVAQSFLPPREADWADLLADGIGIALGLLAALPISASASRRR